MKETFIGVKFTTFAPLTFSALCTLVACTKTITTSPRKQVDTFPSVLAWVGSNLLAFVTAFSRIDAFSFQKTGRWFSYHYTGRISQLLDTTKESVKKRRIISK